MIDIDMPQVEDDDLLRVLGNRALRLYSLNRLGAPDHLLSDEARLFWAALEEADRRKIPEGRRRDIVMDIAIRTIQAKEELLAQEKPCSRCAHVGEGDDSPDCKKGHTFMASIEGCPDFEEEWSCEGEMAEDLERDDIETTKEFIKALRSASSLQEAVKPK